jgi:hypothetical protein
MLGAFNFDSNKFGNTLLESDGGAFRKSFWLNVVDADPGNPGALTGSNFKSGIANIGSLGTLDYTIGYSTPIVNGPGNDMGLVSGFSVFGDIYHVAVSTDGTTFSPFHDYAGSAATDTSVSMSYFNGGPDGTFSTNLFVTPIDLSDYGIASGGSIVAVKIEGRDGEQPDVFRIAGFVQATPAPEPASLVLLGLGAAALAGYGWRLQASV